jgi:hypothetical protein
MTCVPEVHTSRTMERKNNNDRQDYLQTPKKQKWF